MGTKKKEVAQTEDQSVTQVSPRKGVWWTFRLIFGSTWFPWLTCHMLTGLLGFTCCGISERTLVSIPSLVVSHHKLMNILLFLH